MVTQVTVNFWAHVNVAMESEGKAAGGRVVQRLSSVCVCVFVCWHVVVFRLKHFRTKIGYVRYDMLCPFVFRNAPMMTMTSARPIRCEHSRRLHLPIYLFSRKIR
jgi:hypothetical protein